MTAVYTPETPVLLPRGVFNFKGQQLRTAELEGEPWFCGSDVLNILYGKAQGMAHTYSKLDSDEKLKVKRKHLSPLNLPVWVASESGLYKLIMRSDKAEAVAFQNGVTREVLPSIRRTGGYLLNEEAR